MGLVNKLKSILFEEEEVEIPVIEKKEKAVSEPVVREVPKQEVKQVPDYSSFYDDNSTAKPLPQREKAKEETIRREEVRPNLDTVSERELFKSEKTFNFPDFDEAEFENSMPRRTTNVMEHERKKLRDKRNVKPQNSRPEETKEVKTKFRPSPIISPVYGILDKNYTPEDITTRETIPKALDVDSVRKKAFGTLEEEIMDMPTISKYDDEDKFLEEKLEKARTIDELLKDSSDDIISVDDNDNNYVENVYNTNEYEKINLDTTRENRNIDTKESDSLDEAIEALEEDVVKQEDSAEDSLESDLFDLIDSMYENREDGE